MSIHRRTHALLTTLAALATLGLLALLSAEARAEAIELRAEVGSPLLVADRPNTAVLKVSLRGLDLGDPGRRAPVNLAIVLDKSGSMAGSRLAEAKAAALGLVDRLRDDDLIAIVAYDGRVKMLVPTTRAGDRQRIRAAIAGLDASGSTALFAGVSKGISEVRKFFRDRQVNRVILLSDGKANIGPSSANALGRLGAACSKEQISITTVGLGLDYNEDLMVQLARRSDGNHAFAAAADDLHRLFTAELGDITSVVAQAALIHVDLGVGVRPLRVLGRDATITGQRVTLAMSQVYSNQEKFILIEAEVPPAPAGSSLPLAVVTASYLDLLTGTYERADALARVHFTASLAAAEAATSPAVMIAHAEAIANDRNRLALDLRDRGEIHRAQSILEDNSAYLESAAARYNAPKLKDQAKANISDAKNLESEQWNRQRKVMRKRQYEFDMQQSY